MTPFEAKLIEKFSDLL